MEQCVSVIVPIYMVEPYLKRAVDSILNQTYSNLEIILVDDGSPDQCGQICDDYAKKDNRIVVIHKENGGLSDARNAGLDVAKGDYIAFVDSDDYIAPDYVETLMKELQTHDGDVAMCSYAVTDGLDYDENLFQTQITHPGSDGHEADKTVEVCDKKQLLSNLYDANHRDATYFIVSWNKLYKADLWKDIRFPKGKIHEDEATTYRIYAKAQKGVYIHKPLYGYFSAPKSITRAKFNLKRLDWMDALDGRIDFYRDQLSPETTENKEFWQQQIAYAKRAQTDAAIHYYYPLKEALPQEKAAAKRLKSYVTSRWMEEKRMGYLIFILSPTFYRLITNVDRDKKERIYQIAVLLLFGWLAFLCFNKLDVKYVDPWDESRHGVNAYEMLQKNKLIESTYRYETDYYNLKPPLSMWTIIVSMLIFGKNIFSLRVASVVFYLILAGAVTCFTKKRYGSMASVLSLALLSANTTPFIAHMVRAGDADSLYVLLFSLAMICMLQIRENPDKLYGCGIFFALAFLTKSFHAGIIVAIGGLFLLLTGELKRLNLKQIIKFIGSFSLPLLLWAVARWFVDGTEFFKNMWLTDVLGRSKSGFGSNEAGFSYYFSYYLGNMTKEVPVYRIAVIIMMAALILLLWATITEAYKKDERYSFKPFLKTVFNRDVIGIFLWIVIPALAFSMIRTKLLWYQYPAITALLIGTGIAAGVLYEKKVLPGIIRYGGVLAVLITVFIYSRDLFITFQSYGVDGHMTNDFQLLVQEVANTEKESTPNTSSKVYCAFPTDDPENPVYTVWAQQDVFVAEAYGDFYCADGGVDSMVTDEEGILFTTKGLYEIYKAADDLSKDGSFDKLGERGEYVALRFVP